MEPLVQEPGDGEQRRYGPGQAVRIAADRQGTLEERKARFKNQSTETWAAELMPQLGLPPEVSPYMEVALEVADTNGDIAGFMENVVPEASRGQVAAGLVSYADWMDARESTPLAQTTHSTPSLMRMRDVMLQPGGIETLEYMADLTGDQTVLDGVNSIKSMTAQATAARVLGAGPAATMGQDDYLSSRADISVAMGIQQGLKSQSTKTEKVVFGSDVWYQDKRVPLSDDRLKVYLEATERMRGIALEKAQEYGIPMESLGKQAVTQKEAQAVLDATIKVLEQTQPKDIEKESVMLELGSQEEISRYAATYLRVLSKYAEKNPEEAVTLEESMESIARFMQGAEIREDEIGGVTSLLVGTLNVIAAPDRAAAALTTAAQPKIRPTGLVFEDGFVASDTLAAAEHSMLLQAQGYAPAPSPASKLESEASRAEALLGSAGESVGEFFEPTWKNLIPGYAALQGIDVATRGVQAGSYGAGVAFDAAFGGLGGGDESGVAYAYPVPVFETVTEETAWGDRWGNAVRAFTDADGEFIFEGIYDQAMSGAGDTTLARKFATGISALAWEFAVSPWNMVGTGQLSAKAAETAKRAIGAEASKASKGIREVMEAMPAESPKVMHKAKRSVKFDDGREMNAIWTGAHDILAQRLGRGKGADFNAADEMSSMILTAVRDNPAKSTQEIFELLKADPQFLRRTTSYAQDLAMPGVVKKGGSEAEQIFQAQKMWESVEGDVASVVDAASKRMGPKWTDAADRANMMEQARGLFVGGVGFPTSRASRMLDKANEGIAAIAKSDPATGDFGMRAAKSIMDKQMATLYTATRERLENGLFRLQSGFSADAYSTGLAAHGGRNILPEVKAVPFRMKKLFQEQYRRRMASAEQAAQGAVFDVFHFVDKRGKTQILQPEDRMLVTLLADVDMDMATAISKLSEKSELLRNAGVKVPNSVTAWQYKAQKLEPYVSKLRTHWDAFGEQMLSRGLTSPDQMIDAYMPRIYKGISRDKLEDYISKKAAQAAEGESAKAAPQARMNKGTHARQRHGPVELLEAIEKGFDPELDAAALLYTRAVQFNEVEAKAVMAERIASEFGQPVINRRETLARMLHDGNTATWESNGRVVSAAEEATEYAKSLGKVTSAIRDSAYRKRRRGSRKLAEALGVKMHTLTDPKQLTAAMIRSEKFWAMAGTKGKNMLDKILSADLRDALRKEARGVRAEMKQQAKLRPALREAGVPEHILARFGDNELGFFEEVSKILPEGRANKAMDAFRALRKSEMDVAKLMDSPAWREAAKAVRDETSNLTAAHRLIQDRIAAHGSRYNMTSSIVRQRALTPKTSKGAIGAAKRAEKMRASLGLRKSTRRQQHVPAGMTPAQARGYVEAEEMFGAFGWTSRDTSAFLWDTFGAHHMTEVPVAELKAAVGSNGGMMAKVGRFLFNPADYEGRKVALRLMGDEGLDNGREIAKLVGVNTLDRLPHQWGDELAERLDDLFARASAGEAKAQELVGKIEPAKLSKVFVPQDVGEAAMAIVRGTTDKSSSQLAARMVSNADSPLARKLGNTYIPLEIGLMHKQMVGEGIAAAEDVMGYALTTKMLKGLGNWMGAFDVANTTFKTAATVGRGSFAFGRRNAWGDGAKNLLHLGLYGAMSRKARKEFFEDMARREGMMMTPNGPLSMKVFHEQLDRQGYSMFSQRLDRASMLDLTSEKAIRGRKSPGLKKRARLDRELESGVKLRRTGKLLDLEKEQKVGLGVGAVLGEAIGDPLLGAAVGYTGGTLTHGFRDVVSHTGGSMPRKIDFVLPIGAAANERMENFYRAFAYWSQVKGGLGVQEAMTKTLGMMRDYSNMTPLGQDILRRVPILFYNFTHQNVIAMSQRLATSPARATFMPRLISALTGKDEGSADFQTVSSTLKKAGFAYYMSDEFEAAVSIFEPIWQLAHGEVRAAGQALMQTMSPVITETLRYAEQKDWKRPIPQAIARRVYDQLGAVDVPGFTIGVNENGAIYGEMHAVGAWMLDITAINITANDVGRAQSWVDRGDVSKGVLEYVFGVKAYDLDSFFGGRRDLLDAEAKKVFDGLDGLQWDENARQLVFENPQLFDAEHQHIMEEFQNTLNGKYMMQAVKDFQKLLRDHMGQSRDLAPTQPTGNTTLELNR